MTRAVHAVKKGRPTDVALTDTPQHRRRRLAHVAGPGPRRGRGARGGDHRGTDGHARAPPRGGGLTPGEPEAAAA
ncbi:hypothetical protein [Amycolatopsis sp. lyj-346]|uniref:hypothetical protein n=1 Tax=Amycolatopsis sp. lyj-346 TaxID=2789289 RepID=UPI00397BB7DE